MSVRCMVPVLWLSLQFLRRWFPVWVWQEESVRGSRCHAKFYFSLAANVVCPLFPVAFCAFMSIFYLRLRYDAWMLGFFLKNYAWVASSRITPMRVRHLRWGCDSTLLLVRPRPGGQLMFASLFSVPPLFSARSASPRVSMNPRVRGGPGAGLPRFWWCIYYS